MTLQLPFNLSSDLSVPLQLDLYGDDTATRVGHVRSYADEIAEAIVTAYAEALAGAANYYDANSCVVLISTDDCDRAGPCPTRCTASAVGDAYIEEIDAIATAGMPPAYVSRDQHKLLL